MACADVDMDIHGDDEGSQRVDYSEPEMVQYYQATELLPDHEGPLHDLMQKQPAVLGSLQMISGLLSCGVGILFAINQEIQMSLLTLFRLSHFTGLLFIIAGVVTNLLCKYPGLLPVSLVVNYGCIIVALPAACMISVDLAHLSSHYDHHIKMEALVLSVLGLETFLSAVLCFWFSKERRTKSL